MDQSVYLGLWTNWSRGSVLGLTFTTTRARGNLLIAFTAFFISFVATRVWKIVCLALHRSYSTSEPCDTAHHQQQVILRNSSSPESGIVALLRLVYTYRSSLKGRLLRRLSPVLLAILLVAGFSIAGGFSSSISSAVGDEVLATSANCGIIAASDMSISANALRTAVDSKRLSDATQYAQHCYAQDSAGMAQCQRYVVGKIATNVTDTSAPCPFEERICRTKENIRLDTGYVNSHSSIGLNAPESGRFAWRYVMHCAPLKTEGYTTNVTQGNSSWVRYHYGRGSSGSHDDVTSSPVTYAEISTFTVHGKSTLDGLLQPIPELDRPDGDVTIVFLVGNGVEFFESTDDAWYRATAKAGTISNLNSPETTQAYRPSEPASPMGCVEQWQWCNLASPTDQGCGPLARQLDAIYGAAPFFNLTSHDLDPDRPAVATSAGTRLVWPSLVLSSSPYAISSLFNYLGDKALASQDRFYSGVQWPIPLDQWQRDVTYWWHTMLSVVQAAFVETVYSNPDPELNPLRWGPLNPEEQKMCQRQKIRTTSYTSFNVFGLYFTYITGTVLVVISYSLEPLFQCLRRRRGHRQYAHLEWVANEQLQLHRLAHEPIGENSWYGCAKEVPTTDPNVRLPALDISDLEHPCFCAPGEKGEVSGPSLTAVDGSEEEHFGGALAEGRVLADTLSGNTTVDSRRQYGRSSAGVQVPTEAA
ncbi:hypothetical protein EKO27_g5457 [Xylaria grammica]|uniref:Uncharacterized protein n=1 Tax=Xylaria grammica TaxID=363999 RepID=A0A439D5G1_9PEZI|nr:hypothetical protein EKO27_g5457 [Xylaria grammica]